MLAVYSVEYVAELTKLNKRGFAHQAQHFVVGMLLCHFQSTANVVFYKFLGVFCSVIIQLCIAGLMKQHVVSDTAANETFLYSAHGVHTSV